MDRMFKYLNEPEEQAVDNAIDEITGIIFGEGATLVEDAQSAAEDETFEEMPEAPAPCAIMIEELPPKRPEVFVRLELLNSAIDALCTACGKLELLDECKINLDYALISQVQQLEAQLRSERVQAFEHLIDWNKIAEGH